MVTLHLSHVGLGVDDVNTASAFYASVLGLSVQEHLDDGAVRLGWGSGFHGLELAEGSGVGHIGFEVAGDFHAFVDELTGRGVTGAWATPQGDHPRVFVFADPDGNKVELHDAVDRPAHGAATGRRPLRVHHVTFASSDMARLVDFYVDVVGLRVSDRMGDRFTWLRSDAEHHSLAVVASDTSRLDHYAYEIVDWADMKRWCDELAVREVELTWGPGRHGPGNNLFVMFDDPTGYRIELSCEMERFWDGRVEYARSPRNWAVDPRTVNLWGPSAVWRDTETKSSNGAATGVDAGVAG
jgi:catechol 2,3-dioxygenase-like lactoylglutathione lyase family enzyme